MFTKLSPIGLDISDGSLEMTQIYFWGHQRKIRSLSRVPLGPAIIQNSKIINPDLLKQKLKLAFQRAQPRPFKGKKVIFSIPAKKTFSDIFKLPPDLRQPEIKQYLQHKASKNFPLNLKKYQLTYQKIDVSADFSHYLVAAVSKSLLLSYRQFLESFGLELLAIDLEALGLARALIRQHPRDKKAVLILDIGAQTTDIHIFDEAGLAWSSSLKLGGDDFTQDISQGLSVSLKEAEVLKRECGFLSQKHEGRIINILQASFQPLLKQLKSTISYYQARSHCLIKEIILAGGSALIPGSIEYLIANLGETIEEINLASPFSKFRLKKWPSRWPPLFFCGALGLCLWTSKKQNLLKFNGFNFLETKRSRFPWLGFLKKLLVVLALILLAAAISLFFKYSRQIEINPASNNSSENIFEFRAAVVLDPQKQTPIDGVTVVPGRKLTTSQRTTKECSASGISQTPTQAQGQVTLFNNTGEPQILVKNTCLLSEGLVLFHLKEEVVIPANGEIETLIIADEPGEPGNIEPGLFILPDLSDALQEEIFAQSEESMSGGGQTSYLATEADMETCVDILKQQIIEQMSAEVQTGLTTNEILVSEPLEVIIKDKALPLVNQEGSLFEVGLELESVFIVLDRPTLEAISQTKVEGQLGSNKTATNEFSFAVDNFDLANQVVYFIIKTRVD